MTTTDRQPREINTPEVRQAIAVALGDVLARVPAAEAADALAGDSSRFVGELAGAVYVVLDRASAGEAVR